MVLTTVANVAAYLQTTIDGSSTPNSTTVTQWITWAEAEIERRTGQKFESTAITNRVIDLDRYNVTVNLDGLGNSFFFTDPRQDFGVFSHSASQNNVFHGMRIKLPADLRPIIALTSVERNIAGPTDADSYETLTENTGTGGDYVLNLNEAEIDIMKNFPRIGNRAIRINGTHGYATVPLEVEALATMLTARRVLSSSQNNSVNDNFDNLTIADLSISKGGASSSKTIESIDNDLANQWEVVGQLYSQLV